jgi:integrase
MPRNSTTLLEELVTPDEAKQMVDAAACLRNRALIFGLYESGCRIGEIASLQLKHVTFDDYGAQLVVTAKAVSAMPIRQCRDRSVLLSVPGAARPAGSHRG